MKSKNIFVVYNTDTWNRNAYFLGVFTTKKKAIKQIIAHSNNKLSKDDLFDLEHQNQTQGRQSNYDIEITVLNPNL